MKLIFHLDCEGCGEEYERDVSEDKAIHLCLKCKDKVIEFIKTLEKEGK